MSAPAPSVWLVGPRWDVGLLVAPALAMVALGLVLPEGLGVSPLVWLVVVVGIDVAHVYASIFRTLAWPAELRRRPALYLGLPVGVGVGLGVLHALLGPAGFWRVLAYVAVVHFVRQQWGFAALYRLREGLGTRTPDARWERYSFYAVTGLPLLWWHVHLPRDFAWFVPGDFVGGVPAWTLGPAAAATVVVLGLHLRARWASRRVAWGRDLWLATTAAVWFGGIVLTHSDLAFTLTNVVAHGVPYVALVWLAGRRQWQVGGAGPLWPGAWRAAMVPLLLGLLLLLALSEEALWDALVWHDHEQFFGAWSPPDWLSLLAVPLLAVPQVTHYLLDGFIWKLDGSNPGLREALRGG